MRILIFGLSPKLGGVESFLLNYSHKLLELDSDICLDYVVMGDIPVFCRSLEQNRRCSFVTIPSRFTHPILYRRVLKERIVKYTYDILWYNACTLSDISLLKIARSRIPNVVVHSHNSQNMGIFVNKILHTLHKRVISKYTTDYFACSKEAASFMFGKPLLSRNQIKIVPNAIDVNRFSFDQEKRKTVREEIGWNDSLIVGHVGRFHPQKNHDFIVKVFYELAKIEPSAKLLLVGEGKLRSYIEKKVESLQLSDKILIVDPIIDIEKYYSAMDVFLFPSLYEGLGMAAVEAQTSGLPTLLSSSIPLACKILDGTVYLSLDEDAISWAKKIIELWNESKTAHREDGLKAARQHGYDINTEAKQLLDYFCSLI